MAYRLVLTLLVLSLGARSMGDGAYLFDPRGNLRAWSIYPTGAEGVGRRLPALGREAVLAPILLLVGAVAQIRRGR